jgi:LytS/YehU family sensor histidine kinase
MFRILSISSIIFIIVGCQEGGSAARNKIPVPAQQTSLQSDAYSIVERQDRQVKVTVLLTLIPVVVAFSFFVFIFYRSRREAFFKQQETEFRLGISELEMKALRAQINPHFIFNCLNSIHHYMHSSDVQLAGDYLIKFSQLIRYVLETSSSRMIGLPEDLEALRLYLELERLRMQGAFEFRITTSEISDPQSIYIPPMMMQPFVENAIWHGLSHKGPGGLIEIDVRIHNGMLQCLIEDNGKPNMPKASVMPGIKKTSMGMALINDRLKAVNRIFRTNAAFRMENRMNDPVAKEGTRIILVLPFEQE